MDNNVIDALVRALEAAGFATLRFNFRGVGASEGAYGGGIGESDDARGAVAWLRERLGLATVALAGYSFGSIVALRAGCGDPSVDRVVAVAPPLAMIGIDGLGPCAKPKLLIVGDADQYCSVASLERAARDLPPPTDSYVVRGTGHFLGGFEDEVGRRAAEFLSR
jgi:alpha/beta superfamily hydrolase